MDEGNGEQGNKKGTVNKGTPTMSRGYMIQMGAMMIMANLYNSSAGRNHDHMARTAMQAAIALANEWEKEQYQ